MHDYDKLVLQDLEEMITIIQKERNHSDYTEALQYSIRCVNEHDRLVSEVERLKAVEKAYKGLDELNLERLNEYNLEVEELKKENVELKEALREYAKLMHMDDSSACEHLGYLIHQHEKLRGEDGE